MDDQQQQYSLHLTNRLLGNSQMFSTESKPCTRTCAAREDPSQAERMSQRCMQCCKKCDFENYSNKSCFQWGRSGLSFKVLVTLCS